MPRITLVLDLDETLVHSSTVAESGSTYDLIVPVRFNGNEMSVYVKKRPHVDSFLARVSELFELLIFTASDRAYAEPLLTLLDPSRRIAHHLYGDSCVEFDGVLMKDLRVLGRDLATTCILDNSPQVFGFQLDHGIPIESWFGDEHDEELVGLLPFFERLAEAEDVSELIPRCFALHGLVHGTT